MKMKKDVRRDTLIYGAAKYSTVVMSLLTTSVLARLVTPEEYGVVTIVNVFTAFFTVLADMGFGTAIIQNKTLTQDEVNDIFGISAYIAFALGVLFALLGIPVAVFYENDIYRRICPILGISVFFNAVNIVPNAILMKEKRFRVVGKRLLCVAIVSGLAAVVMAWYGFGCYAIVFQSVLQSMLIFAWNIVFVRLKVRMRIKIRSIKKVWGMSIYQFLYNFINYLARNLDNLLIGKTLGAVPLAYYDKGYRLMMYPVQNLTYVINPILHPVLSDYQDNRAYIYEAYLRVTHILSIIGVFISAVCFWGAEELIFVFFGNQWTEAVTVFRVLSLTVWPQMICSSAGSIYQSTGNTRLMFLSGSVHFTLTIMMIIIGIIIGNIQCVAICVTISLFLRFFIDYYVLIRKNFTYSYMRFLASFRHEALWALGVGLCIAVCGFDIYANHIVSFGIKAGILLITMLMWLHLIGELGMLKTLLFGNRRHRDTES